MRTRPLWLLSALLLAGTAAAVETPPPLTIPDLTGPRSLALGGGVGAYTGTEALFLNPAAMAARKRYTVDAFYLTDRRPSLESTVPNADVTDARQQDYFGGSVMDSATTPVAAGFGYVRQLNGVQTGTLLRLGLAAPVTQGLFVGLQGNYFDLSGTERVASTLNLDAGLFYQVTSKVSIGAAGYNLIHSERHATLPQAFAAGFAIGSETSFQLTGDWRMDTNRVRNPDGSAKSTNRYGVGAEYLFANAVPVRAGFQVDDVAGPTLVNGQPVNLSRTKWWSVGAGWVSTRASVDLGYRQSTTDPTARTLEIAVRMFVPTE